MLLTRVDIFYICNLGVPGTDFDHLTSKLEAWIGFVFSTLCFYLCGVISSTNSSEEFGRAVETLWTFLCGSYSSLWNDAA